MKRYFYEESNEDEAKLLIRKSDIVLGDFKNQIKIILENYNYPNNEFTKNLFSENIPTDETENHFEFILEGLNKEIDRILDNSKLLDQYLLVSSLSVYLKKEFGFLGELKAQDDITEKNVDV